MYNSSCTHEEFFDFDQAKSSHLMCIKWLCKNAKRNHFFVKREKTKDKRQTRTEEKEKETILQRIHEDVLERGFDTSKSLSEGAFLSVTSAPSSRDHFTKDT